MTYKTRQEVLRAAADWMDVCEASGIEAMCKFLGEITRMSNRSWDSDLEDYEFPLALLEGKEVWSDSTVWNAAGFQTLGMHVHPTCWNQYSWNPPKPKTVMVEMLVEDVEFFAKQHSMGSYDNMFKSCKKALKNLK